MTGTSTLLETFSQPGGVLRLLLKKAGLPMGVNRISTSYIRPFGDTASDLSKIGAGAPLAGDPTAALIATVNRFPGQHFPLATGKVPSAVAIMALTFLQQSLITAIPDEGMAAQLTTVNAAFRDPVGYVTKNLSSVTAQLAGYADTKGYPKMGGGSSSDSMVTALAIGGALLVAWMVWR